MTALSVIAIGMGTVLRRSTVTITILISLDLLPANSHVVVLATFHFGRTVERR
jgi:hypothetical protein